MKRARTIANAGLLLIGAMTARGTNAFAQGGIEQCASLNSPVYMGGTTAVLPVIRHFGAKLKQVGVTLLWNENSDGCSAAALTIRPVVNKTRTVFTHYAEDNITARTKIIPTTCNGLPDQPLDLVINDVYFSSCPQMADGPLPASFKEFLGPVQGLVPIVASSYLFYNDITAEELQNLYICGARGNILTFTVDSTIYDFSAQNSGIRALFGRTLGLVNGLPHTTRVNDSLNAENVVISYVGATTTPETTTGYTSTEFYDENRDRVRALKVRGINQKMAYLPDTDLGSTDKINIREGRYTLQGALKLLASVDASGVPTNPQVKKIIDWMQDNPLSDPSLALPFDLNQIYATRGVVPQCAMRVTKVSDQLGFKRYRHPTPCHCSFEKLATGAASVAGCVACVDSSTCAVGQVCSKGYCE